MKLDGITFQIVTMIMNSRPQDLADARRRLPDDAVVDCFRAPDGWAIRRLRLPPTAGARGSILFAGGRGDFIEKYLETLLHWRAGGWAVESFDWRGQGLSGRILPDSAVGHATSFAPWIADLTALVADWRATTPGPHILVGHSTGGHLALRHLAANPDGIDAAVIVAPLLGLGRGLLSDAVIARIARWMVARGRGEAPAWGQGGTPSDERRRRALTSCAERFPDEGWWWAQQPAFRLGGASWGWIAAALESIGALTRPGVLEGLKTPLLLLSAQDDPVVSTAATRRLLHRLPDARAVFYPGARHELLREADAIRLAVWREIDSFIGGFAAT